MGFDYKGRGLRTNVQTVDYDFAKTLDLSIGSGRMFSREYGADSLSMVINEAMVKEFNETENPLATRVYFNEDSVAYSVIGVIKDYNFKDVIERLNL